MILIILQEIKEMYKMSEDKKLVKPITIVKPTLNDYANEIMRDDKFGQIEEITINNKTKTIKATFNNGENRIVQTVTVNSIGTIGTSTSYPRNMSKLEFIEAIRELRNQPGSTQATIANILGISQSYVSQLEKEFLL